VSDQNDEPDALSRSGIARALAVIRLLAERAPQELGVTGVARELQMPKTVAHRILRELTALDFLGLDEGTKRYRLGPGALQIGLAALRGLDVPRLARPHLWRLVQRTGETATLSVRQGWSRVYVDQVLSPHEIRMSVPVGTAHPLHAGSSSKAILAGLSDAEVDEYLATHALDAVTAVSITSENALRAEIERVRAAGYATSSGERQAGAGSVAAAIRTASGDVFGSISVCGPLDRFGPEISEAYGGLVAEAARQISAELGYRAAEAVGA
jgi:IclR family acetate operon transcriptional repressor